MKTKCKCSICDFKLNGNSKWKTERDMWEHIKNNHGTELLEFYREREAIRKKIDILQKTIPFLYITEYQGTVMKGSWTI